MALITPRNIATSKLTDGSAFLQSLPAGATVQTVQRNTQGTGQYASTSYSLTDFWCEITPLFANSKILITVNVNMGVNAGGSNHDVAMSFNFVDNQNPAGATAIIAPNSTNGGTSTGASGARMAAYGAAGCFANVAQIYNYWIAHPTIQYLYTPSYQNTNTRRITTVISTAFGFNVVENKCSINTTDPRDVRPKSVMTLQEIKA